MGRDVPRAGARRWWPSPRTARPRPSRSPVERPARRAIALDPKWRGGDYYDAAPGDGPHAGLALARQIAQITLPHRARCSTDRFGREPVDPLDDRFTLWQRFDVEGYLDYHGAKLARRFDANSYLRASTRPWTCTTSVGAAAGSSAALRPHRRARCSSMGIDSDTLYPPYQQELIDETLAAVGGDADPRRDRQPRRPRRLPHRDRPGRRRAGRRSSSQIEKDDR